MRIRIVYFNKNTTMQEKYTIAHLNEWKIIILDLNEDELHKIIIDKHDQEWNFVKVKCIWFMKDWELFSINKNIKLYSKRILFFYWASDEDIEAYQEYKD